MSAESLTAPRIALTDAWDHRRGPCVARASLHDLSSCTHLTSPEVTDVWSPHHRLCPHLPTTLAPPPPSRFFLCCGVLPTSGPPFPCASGAVLSKPTNPSRCAAGAAAAAMNAFRFLGDMTHLFSVLVLLLKIYATKSCSGKPWLR